MNKLDKANLISKRETICFNCEHKSQHLLGATCKLCKCIIYLKVRLVENECPIKKW